MKIAEGQNPIVRAMRRAALVALGIACACATPRRGWAQGPCFEWVPGLFPRESVGAAFLTVFDDGTGPEIIAGGEFTAIGGMVANRIARWNGTAWAPLGTGLNNEADAVAVYDDGSGVALYAAGRFTTAGGVPAHFIARWNGASWSELAGGPIAGRYAEVEQLGVFDEGSASSLVAAGFFSGAGGVPVHNIARWNGREWSALGSGIDGTVRSMQSFDDGSGSALWIGGFLETAGGTPTIAVARWNGSAWSAVDAGMESDAYVESLTIFDDGTGRALYAGGSSSRGLSASTGFVRKWDGNRWVSIGSEILGSVRDLEVFDDGAGPALYVSGGVSHSPDDFDGDAVTAKWNGLRWVRLGDGSVGGFGDLVVFDDGSGRALYSSAFDCRGGRGFGSATFGRWNGSAWSMLAPGIDDLVYSMTVFDDGTQPTLVVGGYLCRAGTVAARRVAQWDGHTWSALGTGIDGYVYALAAIDAGQGNGSRAALFAGGNFTRTGSGPANGIAQWNGSSWSALGSGVDGELSALAVFDDGSGPALFAGGSFRRAGAAVANHVARWDGRSWSALGTGVTLGRNYTSVQSLKVIDDGAGPALYVGGSFTNAGGVAANNIARWDGATWSALGDGVDSDVSDMVAFDDGSGPAVFVSGSFSHAGGVAANLIAKWNGTEWSALPSEVGSPGSYNTVLTLEVFDDGRGPALYATGSFRTAGGIDAQGIARFDGTSWSPLGGGLNFGGQALAVFDDGSGPALFAGGGFTLAGGVPASYLAKWGAADPLRGNVHAASGRIVDVLRANDSSGDAQRRVHVAVGQPVSISLRAAPAGPSAPTYAMWIWPGSPSNPTEFRASGNVLGCLTNPTPLRRGDVPQPFTCLRGVGVPSVVCAGVHERLSPARAPWTLTLRSGFAAPRTILLQGVITDAASSNASGASVTNAVVLEAR
ncbi:MAG: hypothetical protein HY292_25960 [Planctomycetes bacterium]|nr:hypothetical protein [Planctomycetota bacterium]